MPVMAPLVTDPQHLRVVLNPARRKALYDLTVEITGLMQSQLMLPELSSSPTPHTLAQPSPDLIRLRAAALSHFQTWRRTTLSKLEQILKPPDDKQTLDQRRKRAEGLAAQTPPTPSPSDANPATAGGGPVATRLATIPRRDREELLSGVLLVLLSAGTYPAPARVLAAHVAAALGLAPAVLAREETAVAVSLASNAAAAGMEAGAEARARGDADRGGRLWKVGLASVAGAAVIGVTGGLAAPVVAGAIGGLMGAVGLGGVAGFLGLFWMNGALVGTLFGAFGAKMTGEMVDQYAREVEDFKFVPLREGEEGNGRRLRVVIGVNGWLTDKEDVTKPWRSLGPEAEVFALRYEMDSLLTLGRSLQGLVSSYAWSMVKVEVLKRTVLATLWSALWPAYMLSVASSLDNPFSLARNRSDKAGKILADALINKVQGERPVTLIGYSLGARVIYSCLRTLAERRAFGLVEKVVFIGAPIPSDRNHWQVMRSVVSDKLFNVYSENDLILAFLYRATSIQLGVAGLQEIKDIQGVENLDLTDEVEGHLRYADSIGDILVRCGFPDIRGADGTIKKDDDERAQQDTDFGRAGTLIQLDDLNSGDLRQPSQPNRDGPTRLPGVSRSPQSDAVLVDLDPLMTPSGVPGPAPQPPNTGKSVVDSPNTKYKGTARDFVLGGDETARDEPGLPPYTSSVHEAATTHRCLVASNQSQDGTGENESDEDTHAGIRMVDNDDDLAYIDPIPLED